MRNGDRCKVPSLILGRAFTAKKPAELAAQQILVRRLAFPYNQDFPAKGF
jgi:hypothetical protein